ncbi:hypothetical protein [Neorhizobium vignae]|uniref:hypothetical protein n=1 Tax=Neorhizobium vignae TaxID=690585 RepID=UPI00055FAB24|nr:hypothetical protein [Neorhizobium vignae]
MIAVLEIGRQSNHLQASDYGTVIVPSGWIATSLKKRRSPRGSTVAHAFNKSNHHLLDRAKHSRETLNAGCIMSVEIPTVTPYQAQLRQAHQQRQIKMAAAARRAKIVRTQPEVASRPPKEIAHVVSKHSQHMQNGENAVLPLPPVFWHVSDNIAADAPIEEKTASREPDAKPMACYFDSEFTDFSWAIKRNEARKQREAKRREEEAKRAA